MTLTAPTWGIISHSKPNTLYGQPVHRIWSHVTISGGVKFKSRSATWSWPFAFVRACYWCCLEVTLSALNATESDVDIEALSEHQLTTWHLLLFLQQSLLWNSCSSLTATILPHFALPILCSCVLFNIYSTAYGSVAYSKDECGLPCTSSVVCICTVPNSQRWS